MAETITATSFPASTSRFTRCATDLMRATSATEVPANFCTMRAISRRVRGGERVQQRLDCPPKGAHTYSRRWQRGKHRQHAEKSRVFPMSEASPSVDPAEI